MSAALAGTLIGQHLCCVDASQERNYELADLPGVFIPSSTCFRVMNHFSLLCIAT